jgi:serine protease Do
MKRGRFQCEIPGCRSGRIVIWPILLSATMVHGQDTSQPGDPARPAGLCATLDDLRAMSETTRAAVARIRPALVTIESFGGVSAIPGVIGGIRRQGEGNTTGVLLSPDGWIITSTFNFIESPPVITVITSDGQRHVAKLRGRDDTRKVCLLKINPVTEFSPSETAKLDSLNVGQIAITVGVGFGDANPSISTGILSAFGRIGGRAVQTDAKTSPANYGGPLLDAEGRLIGICVPLSPQSSATGAGVEWYDSGIGFAIPLDGLDSVLDLMKSDQQIRPAFVGVAVSPAPGGVMVETVSPGSPADSLGITAGTLLISLEGEPLDSPATLRQLVNRHVAGDAVELLFRLPGASENHEASFALGSLPDQKSQPGQKPPF